MNINELLDYINKNVPNFKNPILLEEGIAYHYTAHAKKIVKSNKFFGAPIDENMDCTQSDIKSPPAKNNPGIVFAYDCLEDAKEEGFGQDIIEIKYKTAISVEHCQENDLDDYTDDAIKDLLKDLPNDDPRALEHLNDKTEEPLRTIVILNTEITDFRIVSK